MSQHTPGPWTAHDDDGTGTLPCVLSDKVNAGGNFYVAQCNVFADARLIAKAPEMYKRLQVASETLEMTLGVAGHAAGCPYRLSAAECQCWRAIVAQEVDETSALLREIEEG